MKKVMISILALSTVLSCMISHNSVKATDFSKKESYYIKLCSSNISNSTKEVCEEFNKYLSKKNSELKKELSETKKEASETKEDVADITSQIDTLESQISAKENEIKYLEKSIKKVEKNIKTKEKEMSERLYAMQTYYNSNSFVDFIFGASDFSDFFSRLNSVNDITAYEKELVEELTAQKKALKEQKGTLVDAKSALESQKSNLASLQDDLEKAYASLNSQITEINNEKKENTQNSNKIDSALEEFYEASKKSETSGSVVTGNSALGNKVANYAMSKKGCPYVWGATGPNRFDCSGLVIWSLKQAGISVSGRPTTKTMISMGQGVSKSNIQTGDIILFSNNGKASGVHHVGIYIGNNKMVHAPHTGDVVKVADLSYSYWQKEWYCVRRLY